VSRESELYNAIKLVESMKISNAVACLLSLLLLLPLGSGVALAQEREEAKTLAFKGGQWFEGQTFQPATFYSKAGRLTRHEPASVDSIINLSGTFVVPPYGDAYVHAFESSGHYLSSTSKAYLQSGVFYARNPKNCLSGRRAAADSVNQWWSVDVAYANGGITAPDAHPVFPYEAMALGYRSFQARRENAEEIRNSQKAAGDCYFVASGRQDVEQKWAQVLEGRPDFIKPYLNESERYEGRQK
jgi:hypothetical protein